MDKKQIIVEYKATVTVLKKATKSKDKRVAMGARKILKDKKLFAEYLAKRIEDREKKLKKEQNPSLWDRCVSFFRK